MVGANQEKVPGPRGISRLPDGLVAGGILIAIGLILLLGQLASWTFVPLLILPALGLVFIAVGIVQREFGWFIPGGILLGLGVAVTVVNLDTVKDTLSGEQMGAIVLFGLASGFAAITLFAAIVVRQFIWWPLIPAAFLAFVAAALLLGEAGIKMLEWLNYVWPVALILAGVWLLYRRGDKGGTQER